MKQFTTAEQAFIDQYQVVFDRGGNVRLCGRAKCAELIEKANAVKPEKSFGNVRSGSMDIEAVQAMYNELENQIDN